jgi:hypothetical protein
MIHILKLWTRRAVPVTAALALAVGFAGLAQAHAMKTTMTKPLLLPTCWTAWRMPLEPRLWVSLRASCGSP